MITQLIDSNLRGIANKFKYSLIPFMISQINNNDYVFTLETNATPFTMSIEKPVDNIRGTTLVSITVYTLKNSYIEILRTRRHNISGEKFQKNQF